VIGDKPRVDRAFLINLIGYLNFGCHNKAQQSTINTSKNKKTYTIV
jgi:hypothetical protein